MAAPRVAARAGRWFILACALVLAGATPGAAATPGAGVASSNPPSDGVSRPALRDLEFAYSRNHVRWPAKQTFALSCVGCAVPRGQPGAERRELLPGGRDDAATGGATLISKQQRARDGGRSSSWKVLLGAHLASVGADSYTTRRALHSGASEANPMYSWAGNGGALAARLAVGGGVTWLLHRLHKDHPGLARTLAVAAIFANVATSWSNDRLARSNDSP